MTIISNMQPEKTGIPKSVLYSRHSEKSERLWEIVLITLNDGPTQWSGFFVGRMSLQRRVWIGKQEVNQGCQNNSLSKGHCEPPKAALQSQRTIKQEIATLVCKDINKRKK
jgi:hypothetical protein